MRLYSLLSFVVLLFATTGMAQDALSREDALSILHELDKLPPRADVVPLEDESEEVSVAREAAALSSFEYMKWRDEFSQRTYEWQLFSSRIIFVAVLAIVVCGMYFSWLQFRPTFEPTFLDRLIARWFARRREADVEPESVPSRAAGELAVTNAPAPTIHQLEASTTGLKVTTPAIGVVILALSLFFFYLYLHYVYPVHIVE